MDEVNNNETYRRPVLSKFPWEIIRYIAPLGQVPTLKDARTNLRAAIKTDIDIQTIVEPVECKETTMLFSTKSSERSSGNVNSKLIKQMSTSTCSQSQASDNSKEQREPHCRFCQGKHHPSDCAKYPDAETRLRSFT